VREPERSRWDEVRSRSKQIKASQPASPKVKTFRDFLAAGQQCGTVCPCHLHLEKRKKNCCANSVYRSGPTRDWTEDRILQFHGSKTVLKRTSPVRADPRSGPISDRKLHTPENHVNLHKEITYLEYPSVMCHESGPD